MDAFYWSGGGLLSLDSGGKKFRKEVIRTGHFEKASTKQKFEITQSTLANWVIQFQLMKANGVKVPIPSTHEGMGDPDKNRGYVENLFIDGDSLIALCDLIGDDALKAAKRCDVSIFSPIELIDDKGIKYHRPITHVALCTDPLISGLGDFLAASHKETSMKWDKIQASLGIPEELTDDTAERLVLSATETLTSKTKTLDDQVVELKATLAKATAEKPKPDPLILSLAAENRKMKLESLVQAGRLMPAVRDKLATLFIGTDNQALSASLQSGVDEFDKLVAILAENDPVKLKEGTKPQTLKLSDSNKGTEDTPLNNVLTRDAEARSKK